MEELNRTTTTETNRVATTDEARPVTHDADQTAPSGKTLAVRIIRWVLGLIEAILALRLVFALLGANPSNTFANLVYTISEPLARPFFSLFSYQPSQGIVRLELGTIVAMIVYALLAWGIISLLRVTRPTDEV